MLIGFNLQLSNEEMAMAGLESASARGQWSEPAADRVGGGAIALGAAGIVATSVLYGMSPPAAALPVQPLDLTAAVEGTIRGAGTMWWAGVVGVFGDVLVTGGGLVLGAGRLARGEGVAALGWFLIATSTILFAVVDALVGFVLPPLAVASGASGAFLGAKTLFDSLFMLGTATFGLGAVLAMVRARDTVPRALVVAATAVGAAALVGGAGGLFGHDLHRLMGIGILGGSLSFALVGLALARPRAAR
jgi:hypothetical protein